MDQNRERILQERTKADRFAPPERSRAKLIAHSVHDTPQGVMESRERMLRERVAAADTERKGMQSAGAADGGGLTMTSAAGASHV